MVEGKDGVRLAGRCLCGAATFTAVPQGGMHACHCESCRRISGGVSLSVNCGDSLQVSGPVSTYASSEWAERQFCPTCGAGLFWRLKAGGMTMVSIQAFDDPSVFAFEDKLTTAPNPPTSDSPGARPRLTGAEVEALYAPGEG